MGTLEESALTIVPESAPVLKRTAAEIRADVNLIQEVLKAVMKKDVHYGIIPGTPKPTLYKPGAEKILMTFMLGAKPHQIEDLSTPDETRYRVTMVVFHQVTEKVMGYGVGECSSSETKYKWIAPVCDAEFNETPEDRRREKWTKGREKPFKKKQIRPNLQDTSNTILKMAKKRALVDAALTCTGASDVFDQDIEDLPPELRQTMADHPPLPAMPGRASEKAAAAPAAPVDGEDAYDSTEDPPPPAAAAPASRKAPDLSKSKKMSARFDAPCKRCQKMIHAGDIMIYVTDGSDKGAYHESCARA